MRKILLAGLINIETTLRIEGFPLEYHPVHYPFFGVNSTVSGVGYNIAKALTVLGNSVTFLSMIGQDFSGDLIRRELDRDGINRDFIVSALEKTPQSVIIFEKTGNRQIHVDLKNIQEISYPEAMLNKADPVPDLAILCNINFSRPLLKTMKKRGIPIATDIHAIADLDDPYNADYMRYADILFMSHEGLPCSPEDWVMELQGRLHTPIVVVGLGAEGALLSVFKDRFMRRFPAVFTRSVQNTIGGGDALFSAFLHFFGKTADPVKSLRKAMVFASYKIGETGAAQGFLTESALEELCRKTNIP